MICGVFGCVAKSSQCPQACPLYSTQDQCTKAPKIGPVSCAWSESRCTTYDESLSNSTLTRSPIDKPAKPDKEPYPEDPDFGTTLSKRSWAGTIGIIAGVLFGFLGILGILLLIWCKKREKKRRLQDEVALNSTQPNRYRPYAFLQSLRAVVDRNAKELDAIPPLSPLPPAHPL